MTAPERRKDRLSAGATGSGELEPPRIPRALLGLIPPAFRHQIVGDLAEEFASGRWGPPESRRARIRFVRQAAVDALAFLSRYLIDGFRGRRHYHRQPRLKVRQGRGLDTLRIDLRFAWRALFRRPLFTLIAVLTLGTGIGAGTAIFSAFMAVQLTPLPYPEPGRLVFVGSTWDEPDPIVASVPDYLDWRERFRTIEQLSALQPSTLSIAAGSDPIRVTAARVTPDLFDLLGADLAAGRFFTPDEYRTGIEPVAIVSYGLWQQLWGGDPGVIGTSVRSIGEESREGRPYRIVGVLSAGFHLPAAANLAQAGIVVPLPVDAAAWQNPRTSRSCRLIGRLLPGVSLRAATAEADVVAADMAEEFPDDYRFGDLTLGIGVVSLLAKTIGATGRVLWLLLGAAGMLLAIGCMNVANLLLARGTDRGREIAVRTALGAGRGRIIRQLVTESVVLAVLGGAIGSLIAQLATSVIPAIGLSELPRMESVSVNLPVLGFALVLSLVTGIAFGVVPALGLSREDVVSELKTGGGRVGNDRRSNRSQGLLVAAETALALILTTGALMLVKSYTNLEQIDAGFRSDQLYECDLEIPRFYERPRRVSLAREIAAALESVPGVDYVDYVPDPPLSDYALWNTGLYLDRAADDYLLLADAHVVGPHYLAAMEIPLLRGRTIEPGDDSSQPAVALVSRTVADRLWPGEDPVDEYVWIDPESDPIRVIGVVGDIRQYGLADESTGQIYFPYAQRPWWRYLSLMVRAEGEQAELATSLRDILHRIEPDLPFTGLRQTGERLEAALRLPRFNSLLLGIFAGIALLLTAAGVYGTTLYAVGRRRREIGIRLTLGASRLEIVRLTVSRGLTPVVIGIGAGLLGAMVVARVTAAMVFDLPPIHLPTMLEVVGFLIVMTLAACYLPARRAMKADPGATLRVE